MLRAPSRSPFARYLRLSLISCYQRERHLMIAKVNYPQVFQTKKMDI
jgi:hypothetical protein